MKNNTYTYENFLKNRTIKIAKNLLLGRVCKNCYHYYGGNHECLKDRGYRTVIQDYTSETCIYWRDRYGK